jgi:hypothetical protein
MTGVRFFCRIPCFGPMRSSSGPIKFVVIAQSLGVAFRFPVLSTNIIISNFVAKIKAKIFNFKTYNLLKTGSAS